jgi:multiple sugar transport system ATP-binding protein
VAEVALLGVSKSFDATPVLSLLSLQVADGQFCVVLGPSGCGKSTLLRLIAGLEQVDSGQIYIGGKDVTATPPQARHVGMVFQNYALYPHMTVAENIGLPLRLKKVSPESEKTKVREVAAMLGLQDLLERRPRQLSGGQRQRVALGRAIAHSPQAFLFDEPLSNVDALLRVKMRTQIAELWQSLGATVIYVTHDQTEALALGSQICILDGGKIQQIGNAREIYDTPKNRFVAGFVGTPPINFIDGQLRFEKNLYFDPWGLPIPLTGAAQLSSLHSRAVVLGIRPEDLTTVADPAGEFALKAEVERTEYLGNVTWVSVRTVGTRLTVRARPEERYRAGQTCQVRVDRERLHWFDIESGLRI